MDKSDDLAIAFTEAWGRNDFDVAAKYLADDVVFEGPMNRSAGKDAYLSGVRRFAQVVSEINVIACLAGDDEAMIFYDAITHPFGSMRCAELLTIRNALIVEDKLVFDTHPMRQSAVT